MVQEAQQGQELPGSGVSLASLTPVERTAVQVSVFRVLGAEQVRAGLT